MSKNILIGGAWPYANSDLHLGHVAGLISGDVLARYYRTKGYNAIMVEFKYLKKSEEGKIEEKQKEAKEQIERYANTEEMKDIEKMNKYTIVVVNDKLYVEKIKS